MPLCISHEEDLCICNINTFLFVLYKISLVWSICTVPWWLLLLDNWLHLSSCISHEEDCNSVLFFNLLRIFLKKGVLYKYLTIYNWTSHIHYGYEMDIDLFESILGLHCHFKDSFYIFLPCHLFISIHDKELTLITLSIVWVYHMVILYN